MSSKLKVKENFQYNVVGIGSALLDFTVQVDDIKLEDLNLEKGQMCLIDEKRSLDIFDDLKDEKLAVTAGGSSANSVAGVSNLGGNGIFIGATAEDQHGEMYKKFTEDGGVKFVGAKHDGKTGHAITFITPDSERTFATHLGAAIEFNADDVIEENIKSAAVLHMEGYLFESPVILEACVKAMKIAKENDVLVSVDLSDVGLIGRIKDVFKEIIPKYVDIVFANEEEAFAYTGLKEDEALEVIYNECDFAVVKLGENGSLIKTGEKIYKVKPFDVDLVNTNGAGDMYAAGIIYGLTNGFDPLKSGTIGSYAASLVVASAGARIDGKIDLSVL